MKNVLVTGGAGFVGSNLIKHLKENNPNIKITSLDNYFTGKKEHHISGVEYVYGNTWEAKEKFEKQKNRVLGILAARKFPQFSNAKVEVCLAMNENTGWKWAWSIVQCASHKYIGEISERFDNSALADQWIKEQIECMAPT